MGETSVFRSSMLSKEKEKNRHIDAIHKLAQELGVPVEDAKRSYEEALELFKYAAIKDYVPIFVSRCVRERLKHMHHKN